MAWTKAKIGDYEVPGDELKDCPYSVDCAMIALVGYLGRNEIVESKPYIMVEVRESCGMGYLIFT